MNTPRRSFRNIIVLFAAVAVGFGLGAAVTRYPASVTRTILPDWLAAAAPQATTDVEIFRQVWDKIKTTYVESSVSDHQLITGAIQGLVNALNDPYTVYLPKDQAKDFEDEVKGSFEGVGMEVGMKNEQLTIIAPLADSPAAAAGIRAGDVILSIDETDVRTLTLDTAVKKIRGPKGSTVSLAIQRGQGEPQTIKIVRQKIQVQSVTSRTETRDGASIAVLRISSFTPDTEQKFRQAALEALNRNVKGFIIDLRNNPGGYLDQSIGVASTVVNNGPIVIEVDRQGSRRVLESKGGAILAGQKIVVLVNGGSASASEIVAGAWQDTKTATIIGQKTYGKGTVQELDELADGSSLKLTIAKWLTPKGASITDQGITPDVVVERTAEDETADRDPQLEAAIKAVLSS